MHFWFEHNLSHNLITMVVFVKWLVKKSALSLAEVLNATIFQRAVSRVWTNAESKFWIFLIGINSTKNWKATTRHGFTRNRTRRKTGKLIRKSPKLRSASQIINQTKAFCWQRIPKSNCVKKKLLTGTLIITGNSERKFI